MRTPTHVCVSQCVRTRVGRGGLRIRIRDFVDIHAHAHACCARTRTHAYSRARTNTRTRTQRNLMHVFVHIVRGACIHACMPNSIRLNLLPGILTKLTETHSSLCAGAHGNRYRLSRIFARLQIRQRHQYSICTGRLQI